jgi:hypothetical protein
MAFGLVPVCGDIPGLVQDIITEQNGFRVPVRDAEAYTNVIARLHADRDLMEQISVSAQNTITAEFTNERMARRYVDLITSLGKGNEIAVWPDKICPQPIMQSSLHRKLLFTTLPKPVRRILKRLRFAGGETRPDTIY